MHYVLLAGRSSSRCFRIASPTSIVIPSCASRSRPPQVNGFSLNLLIPLLLLCPLSFPLPFHHINSPNLLPQRRAVSRRPPPLRLPCRALCTSTSAAGSLSYALRTPSTGDRWLVLYSRWTLQIQQFLIAILYFTAAIWFLLQFLRSRVDGSPLGPSAAAHPVPLNGPDDPTLVFESRFESGNLTRAVQTYAKCQLVICLEFIVQSSAHCSPVLSPVAHCLLDLLTLVGRSSINSGFTMTSIHKSTHRYLHGVPVSSGCSYYYGFTSVKLPYATTYSIVTKFPIENRVRFQFRVFIKCFQFIILVVLLPNFEYKETQDLQIYHNEFLQGEPLTHTFVSTFVSSENSPFSLIFYYMILTHFLIMAIHFTIYFVFNLCSPIVFIELVWNHWCTANLMLDQNESAGEEWAQI